MPSSAANTKPVTLRSCDDEEFVVKVSVAMQSVIIKYVIEDVGDDHVISLPNVTGSVLAKIVNFWTKQVDGNKETMGESRILDSEFYDNNVETLHRLVQAADYLRIQDLLDRASATVAEKMSRRSPEEIQEMLRIETEAKDAWRENEWTF